MALYIWMYSEHRRSRQRMYSWIPYKLDIWRDNVKANTLMILIITLSRKGIG